MDWQLLSPLPARERDRVLALTHLRRYGKNEVVVRTGDTSDSLHLVESGRLAVRVDTPDGNTAMLSVLGPGDFFGELSLLGGEAAVRTATVVPLEAAATRTLTMGAFAELRQQHPATGELLLTLMTRRIEELSARLVEVMYENLDRRVYRRLLDLARTFGGTESHPATIPLTQEQLSELVGSSRPSVNEVLQRLAAEGTVELGRGRIVVLQPGQLAKRIR